MYRIHLTGSNDHHELQLSLNRWLREEKPEKIHSVRFVADGSRITYCVLVLYVPAAEKAKKTTHRRTG
ncbi:MAG: hypothetical protein QXI12_12730 [Candidatus Methanomethyliaceae archaeon]